MLSTLANPTHFKRSQRCRQEKKDIEVQSSFLEAEIKTSDPFFYRELPPNCEVVGGRIREVFVRHLVRQGKSGRVDWSECGLPLSTLLNL